MILKKIFLIALCLLISLSSYGCLGLVLSALIDEPAYDDSKIINIREPALSHEPLVTPEPEKSVEAQYPQSTDEDEKDTIPGVLINLYTLDMSSPEAFLVDVKDTYNMTLTDVHDYLSGSDGGFLMSELDRALALFTPEFLKALVDEYREYDSMFYILLEGPSTTEFGMTEWSKDLVITLHYDRDPDENGITAAVLAHELAHAVHFIIEEYIGESRSHMELRSFNGAFNYVGDDYDSVWDPETHGYYFAYDYGMYDYYEDIATIIELMVAFPEEMFERFLDMYHNPLIRKTMYIRDIFYFYILETEIFAPLYEAEMARERPAA